MSLEICSISKRFRDKLVIDNFSYAFNDTGLYIIKGESGVGKTTLLRLISGLDTDFIGEIKGGGIANVAFSFQEYRLFPTLSAIDNILKVVETDGKGYEAVSETLSYLNFDKADYGKLPEELSGGMKQRISIVRAISSDKPVLLLDEPLKELDDDLINKVVALLKKESERRLVILVTHAYFERFDDAEIINL